MRILLACHQFFPRYYTGTEVLTLETAVELKARGHEVAIITTEPIVQGDAIPDEPVIKKDFIEGFPVWKLIVPHPKCLIERMDRESYETQLTGLYRIIINEWKPDLMHAFHLMRLTGSLIDLVHSYGIPSYLTLTDFWMICPTYQLISHDGSLCSKHNPHKCYSCLVSLYSKGMLRMPLHHRLARDYPKIAGLFHLSSRKIQGILSERMHRHQALMGKIDKVFFSNPFMQNMFHDNNLIAKHEYIVPFPIPDRSKAVRDLAMPSSDGILKIAFIGTLRHTKGPQVLIEACRRIRDRKDLEAHIWGAAPDHKFDRYLKKLAVGIDWVQFLGTFPQEELPLVLGDCHLVVIPSLWYENTPLIALSSIAARRILIVSDVGGLSSLVVDGVSGYLFPVGDSNKLATLLLTLADNRELLQKISSAIDIPQSISEYIDSVYGDEMREQLNGSSLR